MKPTPGTGSLQIDEDLDFERRQWEVQRAAWAFFALVLLAGLLGLFGTGPLSQAEASSGALSVEYERLDRERSPSVLQVRLGPELVSGDEVTLWLDRAYLRDNEIERMVPEPAESIAAAERSFFRFQIDRQDPASEITFTIEPQTAGGMTGRLGVVDGPEVAFQQFIFP